MATTDRPDGDTGDDAVFERFVSDELVELRVAPTVDARAAAAITTTGLEDRGTPFRARVDPEPPTRDGELGLGYHGGSPIPGGRATETAIELADSLGVEVDTAHVATAAVFGELPTEVTPEETFGLPTENVVTGLAHSSLVHGPFSGDSEATEALLDRVTDGRDTAVPSVVALTILEDARGAAGQSVDRLFRAIPTPDGPFATANGRADVLDVLSEVDPGLALAAAHDHPGAVADALDVWRGVTEDIHEAYRSVPSEAEGPILEASGDVGAPGVLARLVRDFRTTSPVVLVTADAATGVAARDISGAQLAAALPGPVVPRRDGRATVQERIDPDEATAALREVV